MNSPGEEQVIEVLYVDDEPALLEITQIYLQRSGDFIIDTVNSAVEAMEMLRAGSYDIVVSDYMMPGMDGIEFLKKIRASGDRIPYILFTGRGREEVVIEAINNGADFYLQKGGDPAAQFLELANKIRYAVGRRHAEESLESTVKNLILSQEVAHVGNWTLDLKNHIFKGSDESSRLFGYPPSHLATIQEIISHIHPEDRAIAKEALTRLLETGEPYTIDFRIFREDTGEMRYIHSKGHVLLKKDREPALVFGVNVDVTDRKLIEEELKSKNEELNASYEQLAANEEELKANLEELEKSTKKLEKNEMRLERLFDAMSEGLALNQIVRDDDGNAIEYRLLAVNPAFEKIMGLKSDEVMGKLSREAYHTDEPPHLDIFAKVADSGIPERLESYSANLKKYFSISVYRPETNQFATVFEDITDRKLVEEELRESEERFRGMAERSSDMILIIDDSMSVSYASPSTRRIIGFEPEEILRKSDMFAFEKIFPFSRNEFEGVIDNLRKGLPSENMGMQITKKDGTKAFVEMYVMPVTKDGAFAGAQVTIRDITETKKSEQELRESEKRLQYFIDNLPDLILVHRNGIIIYANPAMMESLDIRPEELMNKPILDFILPQYHPAVAESMRMRESTGKTEPYEIELISPRGRRYAAIVKGTIFDYEGSPANLVVLTDITDRKRAEENLSKNEKMLGNAMDLAKMANWELDIETQIFTFNDRFYKIYATTAEREGGYQMPAEVYAGEFVFPDDRHLVADEIKKALDTADPDYVSVIEHRIIRRDGQVRHIVVRIGIIKDEDGRTIKSYGANQDITLRKVAEDAIREANKKLNILSNVTRHDIKNQITAITMLQHLIRQKISDEEILEFVDMEMDAAGQINRLIEFTKEYQDIGVESPRWQKVTDLVKSAEEYFADYPYEIINGLGPVEIYADPLVMKVFYNLLDNVIRHGKNATRVTFSGMESGENYILICEDDGIGILPEMKKDLFKRGHGKNTGYGLYLIREILSITYITIRETGEPGKGARFEITVPKGGFRNI